MESRRNRSGLHCVVIGLLTIAALLPVHSAEVRSTRSTDTRQDAQTNRIAMQHCDTNMIASARSNAPLIVVSGITTQTWPVIARRISDLRTQWRQVEEAKYDPQKKGRIDPELLETYHKEHTLLVQRQTDEVKNFLLQRYDKDNDGKMTEVELTEVLDAFRQLEKDAPNSVSRKMNRYITQARYVDVDNNGLISESENIVAIWLEGMARKSVADTSKAKVERRDVRDGNSIGGSPTLVPKEVHK